MALILASPPNSMQGTASLPKYVSHLNDYSIQPHCHHPGPRPITPHQDSCGHLPSPHTAAQTDLVCSTLFPAAAGPGALPPNRYVSLLPKAYPRDGSVRIPFSCLRQTIQTARTLKHRVLCSPIKVWSWSLRAHLMVS